jgi:integrase/recombinase XerD
MSVLGFTEAYAAIEEILKSRNYSQSTLRSQYYVLRRFSGYLKLNGREDLRDVSEKDYTGFMEYLESARIGKTGAGLKPAARRHYSENLKASFKILDEEEMIIHNPFSEIGSIRVENKISDKVLTEEEMREFMDSVDESTLTGARDRTILELFYGTGIRLKELLALELSDYLEEEKMLFIRQGKGKKDRILPLGERINDILRNYIRKIRPEFSCRKRKTRIIFLNRQGGRMSRCSVHVLFRELSKKCMFTGKTVTPHIIRHSFATHLIRAGADVREVQLLLGHACIDSTEIYLSLSAAHLREIYEKYHPLENELYFDVNSREAYIYELKT